MLQVKTFQIPEQEKDANEFLATHKPVDQGINFNENRMTIFFDDGKRSDVFRNGAIRELIDAAEASLFQQEIAFAVTKDERDNSGAVEKRRYDQLTHQLNELEDGMKKQKVKIAFLQTRLAEYEKAGE